MLKSCRAAFVALGLVLATGCTYSVGYRPDFVVTPTAANRVAGSGAVAMSPGIEQAITDVKPSSMTGGSTTLRLPVGKVVKEITVAVFGATLQDGVISVSDIAGQSGRTYLIEPTVTAFSYKYDQLSNLGFAVTPRVDVSVQLRIRDSSGRYVLDRVYQKSHAQGTYLASAQPHERVNRAFHEAVQIIMTEAATEFARNANSPSPTS